MILREGKTPKGKEVRTVIKHLTKAHPPPLAKDPYRLAWRQPLRPAGGHDLAQVIVAALLR